MLIPFESRCPPAHLSEEWAHPSHLEHEPLDGLGFEGGVGREELSAALLCQVQQDGAALEHVERLASCVQSACDTCHVSEKMK